MTTRKLTDHEKLRSKQIKLQKKAEAIKLKSMTPLYPPRIGTNRNGLLTSESKFLWAKKDRLTEVNSILVIPSAK